MVATIPLRSGQLIRSTAEFFIGSAAVPAAKATAQIWLPSCNFVSFVVKAFEGVNHRGHEGTQRMHPARELGLLLQILQDLPCCIRTRSAGQPCSWMRPRAAQVQILNRRSISSPVKQRAHGEKLIERQFTVKDVTARETVSVLKILRRDDLVRENQLRKLRRVLCQRPDHSVA